MAGDALMDFINITTVWVFFALLGSVVSAIANVSDFPRGDVCLHLFHIGSVVSEVLCV